MGLFGVVLVVLRTCVMFGVYVVCLCLVVVWLDCMFNSFDYLFFIFVDLTIRVGFVFTWMVCCL